MPTVFLVQSRTVCDCHTFMSTGTCYKVKHSNLEYMRTIIGRQILSDNMSDNDSQHKEASAWLSLTCRSYWYLVIRWFSVEGACHKYGGDIYWQLKTLWGKQWYPHNWNWSHCSRTSATNINIDMSIYVAGTRSDWIHGTEPLIIGIMERCIAQHHVSM